MTLSIKTARVFRPLLDRDKRYLAAHGGRGSGKSHEFAALTVEGALAEPGKLSVCIREVQKSLADSAKRLIEAKLVEYGLGEADGFRVFRDVIETRGDGVITFQGMQDHTAESIKSLEGFSWAWVEEAQTLSARSLALLRPTIRAPRSQLGFTWNPRRKTDPVDLMFRGDEPPSNSVVVRANWNDNPWFPDVLEQERLDCLRATPDQYDHIWEGGYVTVAEGAYFAKQLATAKAEGRIAALDTDDQLTVQLFADIGGTGAKADNFVFWAAQFHGDRVNAVDHYEVQGQTWEFHKAWLESRGYTPKRAKIVLPHDGATKDKVINVSYESAMRASGYDVTVVKNQGPGAAMTRVETAREVFPCIWFNEATTTAGREALGWYHPKLDDKRNIDLGPDHDWASHSADAFGLMCVVKKQQPRKWVIV